MHPTLAPLLLALATAANACTYVEMPASADGEVAIARSMELGGDYLIDRWHVVTHPLGAADGWSVNKGFVSIDATVTIPDTTTEIEMISEGMNEDGLTMSMLTLHQAVYQEQTEAAKSDNSSVWWINMVPLILGRYSTVEEAVAALENDWTIVDPFDSVLPAGTKSHWALTDASGASVVIEYLEGQLMVHDNTVGVMTNDPDFVWHLRNLNNYVNLSPIWPDGGEKIQVETEVGAVPQVVGHGFNLAGLPGDYSPPSRFVRAFFLRQYAQLNNPMTTLNETMVVATSILNNVHIVKGTVAKSSLADALEFTQWTVVKSPQKRQFMYRSYDNMVWKLVDIDSLSLKEGDSSNRIPVFEGGLGIVDVTSSLL